jgi:hypothetical protein
MLKSQYLGLSSTLPRTTFCFDLFIVVTLFFTVLFN